MIVLSQVRSDGAFLFIPVSKQRRHGFSSRILSFRNMTFGFIERPNFSVERVAAGGSRSGIRTIVAGLPTAIELGGDAPAVQLFGDALQLPPADPLDGGY
jgi:hypothetical protein